MLVKTWMSTHPITVDIDDSMQQAADLLKKHNIRILPVLKKHRLVGVVTDRDLKRAAASDATTLDVRELKYLLSRIKIRDIMTKDPITVHQHLTVEEAAELLMNAKISGAPVIDDADDLVGVITQQDVYKVLIALTGMGKRGIQFAVQIEDRPGAIQELVDVVVEHKGRVVALLSSVEWTTANYRNVYMRVYGLDRQGLPDIKKAFTEKAKILYIVDYRASEREIYQV